MVSALQINKHPIKSVTWWENPDICNVPDNYGSGHVVLDTFTYITI